MRYQKCQVLTLEKRSHTGKKVKKSGVTPNKALIDDLPEIEMDSDKYETETRDILLYNIPARLSDEAILTALKKKLGLIKKIKIKSQHKYKSVKISVNLEKTELRSKWLDSHIMALLIGREEYMLRWFDGKTTLSAIRKAYAYTTYLRVNDEEKNMPDVPLLSLFFRRYTYGFAKLIRIKGEKYCYAYFQSEESLAAAIEKSLSTEGGARVWIIPERKKSFDIIHPLKTGLSPPARVQNDEVPTMVDEDKVVEVVNKYRQGHLDKEKPFVSTPKKSSRDFVGPDEVVEVVQRYRKEVAEEKEKKKVIEKVNTFNTLNDTFAQRLNTKDVEDIGQKEGNKRVNKEDDRDTREKFQRVIKEKIEGDNQSKLV